MTKTELANLTLAALDALLAMRLLLFERKTEVANEPALFTHAEKQLADALVAIGLNLESREALDRKVDQILEQHPHLKERKFT